MTSYTSRTSVIHWPSLLQFLFSLTGTLILWGIAFLFVLAGVIELSRSNIAWEEVIQLFLLSAGLFFSGALLLPSAIYSLLRLLDKPAPALPGWLHRASSPSVLIFLLPLIIGLGYLVFQMKQLAWLVLPPLHIFAVGLPVAWLVFIGRRGLYAGSPQRIWGIFGTGLVLGPGIILVLELLAVVVIGVLGLLLLSTQPALLDELRDLQNGLESFSGNPEELVNLLQPYLSHPVVIITIFGFVAVIVPLIEEALKPVGVWLVAGKLATPSQGFVAGLLSGAGFALFENLALTTMGGQWAETVVLRIGTALLHIVTAGLTGWAIVLAWKSHRFLRLVLTYLTVVVIHGLWNGLAVLSAASALSPQPGILTRVSAGAGTGLLIMAGIMFAILLASNRSLRKQHIEQEGAVDGLDHQLN